MTLSLPGAWFLAPFAAILSLVTAYVFSRRLLAESEGTDKMIEIAGHVKEGAMAYLQRQYKAVAIVFAVLVVIFFVLAGLGVQSYFVPFTFISGGLWSAVCGYLGMKTATHASARTANACRTSLNKGLQVSFRGGAIMGLVVVGFGLLDVSVWFFALNYIYDHNIFGLTAELASKLGIYGNSLAEVVMTDAFQRAKMVQVATTLLTYAMGASVMALFARVGGGIFTKAADVGADLVGKVEAGIPEDDPRNPATIADNVGDNVGDVAGMGADLYESYCGSILAATALGASLAMTQPEVFGINTIIAPMVVAGSGIIFSLIGIFLVKTDENADQKSLLKSLHLGTNFSAVATLAFIAFLAYSGFIGWGVFGAVSTGLIAGVLIGFITEYYTSDHYKPTQQIADNTLMGPATTILKGFSTGMISAGYPVIVIIVGIILAFGFSGGFSSVGQGVYGIAFAAIGMLSTLGITLATDAFGPIADNAGGNAEMAGLEPEVRQRTDALDSLGNTTAATGKGFAIGSAALTALALIAAYIDTLKQWMARFADAAESGIHYIGSVGFTNKTELVQVNFYETVNPVYLIEKLDMSAIVSIFNVTVINPQFLCGIFAGAMMAFVFCAMTIDAVGEAAGNMVNEVRRQFREIKGILDGTGTPDYAECVSISTAGALRAMIVPSLLAIIVPVVIGLLLGVAGVLGLLVGALTCGFSLAITLNNAGGAWDNAKKYIEAGAHGGKGTEAHKSAVVGDTVGDPFKDTSGPSLNILLKLMTIVSIVFAGVVLKFGLYF